MNENYQWNHDLVNGVTYCMDVSFVKEDLLETVHAFDTPIKFKIGKSFLNPLDNYNHKIGRELSSERLKTEEFNLAEIKMEGNLCFVIFRNTNEEEITFRINKFSEKPHFISYEPNQF